MSSEKQKNDEKAPQSAVTGAANLEASAAAAGAASPGSAGRGPAESISDLEASIDSIWKGMAFHMLLKRFDLLEGRVGEIERQQRLMQTREMIAKLLEEQRSLEGKLERAADCLERVRTIMGSGHDTETVKQTVREMIASFLEWEKLTPNDRGKQLNGREDP